MKNLQKSMKYLDTFMKMYRRRQRIVKIYEKKLLQWYYRPNGIGYRKSQLDFKK